MGVSGFLISCARRLATSPHAASRSACTRFVTSSNTTTQPLATSSLTDKVEVRTINSCLPRSESRLISCSPVRPLAMTPAKCLQNARRCSLCWHNEPNFVPIHCSKSTFRIALARALCICRSCASLKVNTPEERLLRTDCK